MLFSRKKKKLQETPNADFDPTSYSPEELVTILKEWERNSKAHPEIEAWYKSSQAGHVPPWHETQADRDFKIYFPLYEEAREHEKAGNTIKAIEIYLHILDHYRPTGTLYYERPAILLERSHQYKEAIKVCEKALDNADLGIFQGSTEETIRSGFTKRLQRLNKKLAKQESTAN